MRRDVRRGGGVDFVCPSIRSYLAKEAGFMDELKRSSILNLKGNLNMSLNMKVRISRRCDQPYDLSLILDYVEQAATFIGRLHWSEPMSHLEIDLFLTPLKKVWCPNKLAVNLIGKCEVNSGETYFASKDRRHITVWRSEDWSKVILHELFHAFNWDRLVPSTSDNQSEALVETMANIIHCQILAGPAGWPELLEQEKRWMLRQAAALYSHRWEPDKTSVHSYYVIKAALVHNLFLFAQWLRGHSPAQLRAAWPKLVHDCLRSLQPLIQSINTTDDEQCLSMRMVFTQLALDPKPIKK